MLVTFHRQFKSISEPPTNEPIADFVVLSGRNGSGKSNLLDAIEQGAIQIDSITQGQPQIRLFRLSQLTAASEGTYQGAQFLEPWASLANGLTVNKMTGQSNNMTPEQLDVWLRDTLVTQRLIKREALEQLESDAGKPVSELTVSDIRRYAPLVLGIRDPFSMSVGELFLTYHTRRHQNLYNQWLVETKGEEDVYALSDAEFGNRYGDPPWIEMNKTLRIMGLPYTFDPPEGNDQTVSYQARLRSNEDPSLAIATDDLSSGERTLLAITMCLFTGSQMAGSIELPQILLLDEADASLHPAMIQSMLQVIEEIFVGKYGVKVILTTHSPTTVALAPEESLYIMQRGSGLRLARAESRDTALRALTIGIPTLSVRIENRVQVFVEADNDARCYERLYQILQASLGSALSLQFIPSGKKGQGNVDLVLHVVAALRGGGVDGVLGLVDRDDRTALIDGVVYLPDRDSLENLFLDPVALGVYLHREKALTSAELPWVNTPHFELTPVDVQQLTDHVMAALVPQDDQSGMAVVTYRNGATISYSKWALDTDGHKYLARCREVFPQLGRLQDEPLLQDVISKVHAELPQWIPTHAEWLFTQLLNR
jgi:ABC-type branched-subunit amino acid transport system ATPase component